MARNRLTDAACKKAARDRIYYLSDGGGLRLQIRPNGARYWLMRYKRDGKESTHSLGSYPETSLAQARDKRDQAARLVKAGKSPTVAKAVAKATAIRREGSTLDAVAADWLATNKPEWSEAHYERNEGLYRRFLAPRLGKLPIGEIDEPMLLTVLLVPYKAGRKESARRTRAIAGQIFAYAKDGHLVSDNPARALERNVHLKKPPVRSFSALPKSDVGAMLRKLDTASFEPTTKAALQLMLLTALRDHSLRGAKWKEIDFEEATWRVPAERMKRREAHSVPLPTQAIDTLLRLRPITHRDDESFVFGSRGKAGYLAENTLRMALHRMGFHATAHGLRSLLTDVLNESGFNPDAIEAQLHHTVRDKVRAAYLRTEFMDYRRPMMQWFADWCFAQAHQCSDPAMPTNVIPFAAVA